MEPVAPWLSIIIQGGSFALIVYIVTIMWPRAQKDNREERERRDVRFEEMISTLHIKFHDRNQAVIEAIKGQATVENQERIIKALEKNTTDVVAAMGSLPCTDPKLHFKAKPHPA